MPQPPDLTEVMEKLGEQHLEDEESQTQTGYIGSRQGKKMIGGYFEVEVSRQLKDIANQSDKTVQEMLREALNDLFEKYGKPPIA